MRPLLPSYQIFIKDKTLQVWKRKTQQLAEYDQCSLHDQKEEKKYQKVIYHQNVFSSIKKANHHLKQLTETGQNLLKHQAGLFHVFVSNAFEILVCHCFPSHYHSLPVNFKSTNIKIQNYTQNQWNKSQAKYGKTKPRLEEINFI